MSSIGITFKRVFSRLRLLPTFNSEIQKYRYDTSDRTSKCIILELDHIQDKKFVQNLARIAATQEDNFVDFTPWEQKYEPDGKYSIYVALTQPDTKKLPSICAWAVVEYVKASKDIGGQSYVYVDVITTARKSPSSANPTGPKQSKYSGVAIQILNIIEQTARAKNMDFIILRSVATAIEFYYKKVKYSKIYQKSKEYDPREPIDMFKTVHKEPDVRFLANLYYQDIDIEKMSELFRDEYVIHPPK
jgi:hypothetical protein